MSGVKILPLIILMMITGVTCGYITRIGVFRPFICTSCIETAIGAGLVSTLVEESNLAMQICCQIILGSGLGLEYQPAIIAAQAHADPKHVAIITSMINFSRQLDGMISFAVQTAVMIN